MSECVYCSLAAQPKSALKKSPSKSPNKKKTRFGRLNSTSILVAVFVWLMLPEIIKMKAGD